MWWSVGWTQMTLRMAIQFLGHVITWTILDGKFSYYAFPLVKHIWSLVVIFEENRTIWFRTGSSMYCREFGVFDVSGGLLRRTPSLPSTWLHSRLGLFRLRNSFPFKICITSQILAKSRKVQTLDVGATKPSQSKWPTSHIFPESLNFLLRP